MASYHARSNSLPPRQHPITSQIEENLSRLRASEAASTSLSLNHNLNVLQDLHECVDMLLQLPLNQQALSQEKHRNMVEEVLGGSLLVLDVCSTAKDALMQTKECTQELQSILRRRRGAVDMGLSSEVKKYLTSRKAVKTVICKALKNLKQMETKHNTSYFNNDGENGAVISILREVEAVTVRALQSLFSFVSGPVADSKLCRWSLVSKLKHKGRVGCVEEEETTNEIANVEVILRSIIKSDNIKHIENVLTELQKSEMCIQDLEEGLETLFRRLIKARVTVLNILNC